MPEQNTIEIRSKGAVNLNLVNLTPMQGDRKELSQLNFNKLKQSILRHGITFPFFVWQSDGKNYILDGTQRDRVLTRMAEEGFHIPLLPCALIEAKDRKEAAEKILPRQQPIRQDDQQRAGAVPGGK